MNKLMPTLQRVASLDDVRATESVLSAGENAATSATTSDDRHNTSVSVSNSVDKADLAEKSGDVVEEIVMESCKGIKFTDVNNVEFNSEYEFVLMYPFNIPKTVYGVQICAGINVSAIMSKLVSLLHATVGRLLSIAVPCIPSHTLRSVHGFF